MEKIVVIRYLIWHFYDMPKVILKAWKNYLRFSLNYFSIQILLKTFFSHWRKYRFYYGKAFDIKRNFGTLVFNVMSRGIGAVLRSVFIVIGILLECLVLVAGAFVLLVWLVLPLILIFGLFLGLRLILF